MIERIWRRLVCAALQNGYSGDTPLSESGWRGKLAGWLTGTR